MSKFRFAVTVEGYAGADGTDYGVGMGSNQPQEVLVAMTYSKAAAEAEKDRLESEAEKKAGRYWLPGNSYLKPYLEVQPYFVNLGWSEQDSDERDEQELHRSNLHNPNIRKILS
jgi:hypothetical protein